jgi:hypothetical protein
VRIGAAEAGRSATAYDPVAPCERIMTDSRRGGPRKTARILDEDRTFGLALSPDDLSAARHYAIADVHELGRGSYTADELSGGSGLLGLDNA